MTYQEFVKELIDRFGEDRGVAMALRAEVGFLRAYLEEKEGIDFVHKQESMIADFLDRHPRE